MKLYGAHHGGRLYVERTPIGQIVFHPSSELLSDLRTLPDGNSVGVEYFAELCPDGYNIVNNTVSVGRRKIRLDESSRTYWQRIFDISEYKGLNVVFLDDLATWKESVAKRLRAYRKQKQLDRLLESTDKDQEPSPELKWKIEKLRRGIYSDNTEADFIFVEKREEKILENIAKANPDVVIVGSGHSELFIQDREMLREYLGITFNDYAREIDPTPVGFFPLEEYQFERYAKLVRKPPPDASILAGRNSLRRRFFALKLGRILPTERPNFIGTWDREIPARGLFEMYVPDPDGGFEGTIEDCIGSARFRGEHLNGRIRFVKMYDDTAVELGGAQGPIEYEGDLMDGKYQGTTRFEGTNGKFVLEPFTNGVMVKAD